jgi:DNA primase
MSVIEDVKARVDAVEIISRSVKLRKSGRAYMGLCPFHAHKNNTPSFAVWPDTGTWRCFGQCNEGGDIISFVMKRDGLDFGAALEQLAALAGVELKPRTPEQAAQDDNLTKLREILQSAVVYYHHLLLNAPQAEHARQHLAARGLGATAIEMFELGYALSAWDAGLKFFEGKGYRRDDLLAAGLIVEKEGSKVFDRFRDRLMIPVRDETGRMTGFQARALQSGVEPKFMNSPQTALFDKGRTVFGLNLARKPIRDSGSAVVVEGNLDVIAAHQAGFANVVSSQGTALTEHHIRLIKKHAKRIVLALDGDAAGASATLRGLMVARDALEREAITTLDARGLLKVEGRLGTDIRVATLPDGKDPDDIVNADPTAWQALIERAQPVVEYVIDISTRGKNLDDAKVKAEIAATVMPLIEDVANPIERDAYRQKLARTLRVDVSVLAAPATADHRSEARARQARSTDRRPTFGQQQRPVTVAQTGSVGDRRSSPAQSEATRLEVHVLGSMFAQPESLYKIDRALHGLGLGKLAADDFAGTAQRQVMRHLRAALEQFDVDPRMYVRERVRAELGAEMEELAPIPAVAETDDPAKTEQALLASVLRLRKRTLAERVNEARFLLDTARHEQDAAMIEHYAMDVGQHAAALARVDQALAPKISTGQAAGRPIRH